MTEPDELTVADVKHLSDVKFKTCVGLIILLAAVGAWVFYDVHSYTHHTTNYLNARRVVSDQRNDQTAKCLGGILNAVFVAPGAPRPTPTEVRRVVQVDCAGLLAHP